MNTQQSDSYLPKQESHSINQDDASVHNATRATIISAALLARKGDMTQATNLLEPFYDNDDLPIDIIDLLAKIYAQQGKIEQAQTLWLRALQLEPSNLHILTALRMCAYYKKSKYEHFILQHSWLLFLIILWFLVVMAVVTSLYI
ncbi:tetratricopeptide repeat protein [Chloroflexota bacterium]